MDKAIRDFGVSLKAGGVGLFYYSGHVVQIDSRNFLIPLNADIKDACRDNPFPSATRSATRGLSVMGFQAPGSLIVYSTSPGSVASDGDGRNGLFTTYFLEYVQTPGLDNDEASFTSPEGRLAISAYASLKPYMLDMVRQMKFCVGKSRYSL